MGRKKGKQSGEYDCKSERAFHRRTIVSEARHRTTPTQTCSSLGDRRGWCAGGGGGDKWLSIFKSVAARDVRVSGNNDRSAASATSHLHHLLEERRLEDRLYDRQARLRLQRSRLLETNNSASYLNDVQEVHLKTNENTTERHEPGWLLSYDSDLSLLSNIERRNEYDDSKLAPTMPSLQMLAAHVLGPLLPEYCAAIGSHTVGEALTPVSDAVLAELAISLANSGTNRTISDGALRALVHSGTATRLVLRSMKHSLFNTIIKEEDEKDDGEDDSRLLSDNGLLSLCPRFAPDSSLVCNNYEQNSRDNDDDDRSLCDDYNDWEMLDYDMGLNSRMLGCFHLKRLELIDIPLQSTTASSSISVGISIVALRTVLRSCSNLTHLSLSGCFCNWESLVATGDHDDISDLLCGNQNISSLTRSVAYLIKLDVNTAHLVPELMFDQKKFENAYWRSDDVAGLDVLLPVLKVLDVSHCSWVTPSMITRYLLNTWCRDFVFTKNDIANDFVRRWEKDLAAVELGTATHGNKNTRISSRVIPLPRHINVRGCDGLHPIFQWIELLKSSHGLFNGVDLSFDRHDRRQL